MKKAFFFFFKKILSLLRHSNFCNYFSPLIPVLAIADFIREVDGQ